MCYRYWYCVGIMLTIFSTFAGGIESVLAAMAATNVQEGGILAMLQRLAVKVVRPEGLLLIQVQRNVRIVHQAAPKADLGNMSA